MDIVPYAALYIDMPWSTLLKALQKTLKPEERSECFNVLEKVFIQRPNEKLLPTLSVRTATDLFFQSCNFPKGSEILMTCINIPDMVSVVRYHDLKPIPIPIDEHKLAPKATDIKGLINKKTKAIIISYLYGAIYDINEILKIAKEHDIYVIEDCAESFNSPKDNGHPKADLSMFSFGSIKLNTAFGGALTIIRDNEVLYRKMKAIHDSYPILSNKTFLKKSLKNIIPMVALNSPFANKTARRIAIAIDFQYKEKFVALLRGFGPSDDFLSRFRFQMSDAMLSVLALRMKTFDPVDFNEATKRQADGQNMLLKGGLIVPGHAADRRYFWLYPLIVPDVEMCYKLLNMRGVDAYLGATQLDLVESPIGSTHKYPKETLDFFKKIIYLPIHKNVPKEAITKICRETLDVVNLVQNVKGKIAPMPNL